MRKDSKTTAAAIARLMLAAVLPAVMLAACTDTYPNIVSNDGSGIGNDETYDRTPIMLYVNEPNYFSIIATRGTGELTVDKPEKYYNSVVHVFAFRDGPDAQGVFAGDADMTRTVHTGLPGQYDMHRSDCLLDGPDYSLGMPTMFSRAENGMIEMLEADSNFCYSARYQDVGYNFFAYHIDDQAITSANARRLPDRITYSVEIDGAQDIMVGNAPKLTRRVLNEKMEPGNLHISAADQEKILNIGNYSTFAAHRGVNPAIDMRHLLTMFRFTAYPGDRSAANIRIKGIRMESKYSGDLTVAANDTSLIGIAFSEDRADLKLRDKTDGSEPAPPLNPEGYVVQWTDDMAGLDWQARPGLQVGGCLLVAPDRAYTLTLVYEQTVDIGNGQTEVRQLETQYRLRADNSRLYWDPEAGEYRFRPGYYYDVKVVVYGLQPITVEVGIDTWQDGGDIPLDPDDEESNDEWLGDEDVAVG